MAASSRYSRLAPENESPYSPGLLSARSTDSLHHDDNDSEDSILLTPRGAPLQPRRARQAKSTTMTPRSRYLPTSRRFWADFTMGFADGLTVPFALTAGLSSLGRTDTVVFAGLAEVSAGCISMGIGGYLSARQPASPALSCDEDRNDSDDDTASAGDLEASHSSDQDQEKRSTSSSSATAHPSALASRYLAPLRLSADLQQLVMTHIAAQPDAIQAILAAEAGGQDYRQRDALGDDSEAEIERDDDDYVWPVASGLSVALGYLVGGILPLGPYFFVENVGNGLRWSFGVCVVALFLFGFLRDFVLAEEASKTSPRQLSWHKSRIPWRRLWKSTFEGLQMVILGGIAAIAAVLCVRMFDSEKSS